MYQCQSLCNISPRDFEVPGKTAGEKYSYFILGSVCLHLLIVCTLFCWHSSGAKFAIAGNNIVEINLVNLPVKKSSPAVKQENIRSVETVTVKTPFKAVKVLKPQKSKPVITEPVKLKSAPEPVKQVPVPAVIQKENAVPITSPKSFEKPVLSSSLINISGSSSTGPDLTDTADYNFTGMEESNASGVSGGEPEAGISGRQRYIDENFYYVKDLITGSLDYPIVARRMKWQGTVVVSFVVLEDGRVKDIKIVNSSGHSVLDKNVIAAIKEVQPFPPPPADAEFTMPIKYTLK